MKPCLQRWSKTKQNSFSIMSNAHNHVVRGGVPHDYVENVNLEVKFIHGQQ